MVNLYDQTEVFNKGMLEVGGGHSIYFEESGNPEGIALVGLHGGPGSGMPVWWRGLFNPEKYRLVLFDQRGSGRSIPHASLENNTTPDLVEDMEKLREHLSIDKWAVFGGSWGSTLALAYADKHANKISALMMYGIFLCRKKELEGLYYQGGVASEVFPDVFEGYISMLPEDDRKDPIEGYRKLFLSKNKETRHKAIDMWTRLEKRVSRLVVTKEELDEQMSDPDFVLSHSLIENHYFINSGFIDGDKILETIGEKVKNIPVHILQGRYDMVCPFKTAWELHKAVPNSKLHILEDVGHTARDPKVTEKLLEIADNLEILEMPRKGKELKCHI